MVLPNIWGENRTMSSRYAARYTGRRAILASAALPLIGILLSAPAARAAGEAAPPHAADQAVPGAGIAAAEATAGKSALATSALAFITAELQRIQDPTLQAAATPPTGPKTSAHHPPARPP